MLCSMPRRAPPTTRQISRSGLSGTATTQNGGTASTLHTRTAVPTSQAARSVASSRAFVRPQSPRWADDADDADDRARGGSRCAAPSGNEARVATAGRRLLPCFLLARSVQRPATHANGGAVMGLSRARTCTPCDVMSPTAASRKRRHCSSSWQPAARAALQDSAQVWLHSYLIV
jgi:hypothetical protein